VPATKPPPSEANLWATYQQQIAAGAWADAEKTLADLLKLTGDNTRLKAARQELGKRADEARRLESQRAAPTKATPETPQPGRAP
jgi:hypothetical protein